MSTKSRCNWSCKETVGDVVGRVYVVAYSNMMRVSRLTTCNSNK